MRPLFLIVLSAFFAHGAVADIVLTDSGQVRNRDRTQAAGLRECIAAIKREARPARVKLEKQYFVDKTQADGQMVFFMNASVRTENRDLGATCVTNARGSDVVSVDTIDGRYVRNEQSDQLQVVKR